MINELAETSVNSFDRTLLNATLKTYLRASAYASGERSIIEKSLTEDIYYKYFYASSAAAEEYERDIINRIESDNARNIVLSGYKGCGKTTFIHYLIKKLKTRTLLLNFDEIVDFGAEAKTTLILYIYDQMMTDLVENNCEVISSFDEIFYSEPNLSLLDKNYDSDDRFQFLFRRLNYALELSKNQHNPVEAEQTLKGPLKADLNSFDICRIMILIVMWDTAKRYAYGLPSKCCIVFDNLDTIYNSTALPDFVKQIAIFRNNADRIFTDFTYRGQPLCDPTQDYYCIFVMRETTKAEFTDHFHDQKVSMYIPTSNMSHLFDIRMIIQKKRAYLELLSRKMGYSTSMRLRNLIQQIKRMEGLLDDPFLRSDILNLFNHDYRTCFEVLSEINFDDAQFYQSCEALREMQIEGTWNRYGARCLLLRKIYDLFRESEYFDLIGRSEYTITHEGNIYQANLDRLILLFLCNNQNIYSPDNIKENEFVEVSVLFKEFLKFCNDHIAIVDAIWNMYELRKVTYWNHLVTFDEMRDVTRDELRHQMSCVSENKNIRYGKIRITTAGRTYLDVILPQFEYYASRVYGRAKKSLFTYTVEDLLHIENVLSYISNVRSEISTSCKRLLHFFDIVFDKIPEYSGENFLSSKLAWRKLNGDKVLYMYHCERVIHANIGHLDAFRKYALYRIDESFETITPIVHADFTPVFKELTRRNKFQQNIADIFLKPDVEKFLISPCSDFNIIRIDCVLKNGKVIQGEVATEDLKKITKTVINRAIISEISKFINMFGFPDSTAQATRYSENTTYLTKCYKRCISHIARQSYSDFDTSIDRKTGESLLRSK